MVCIRKQPDFDLSPKAVSIHLVFDKKQAKLTEIEKKAIKRNLLSAFEQKDEEEEELQDMESEAVKMVAAA